MMKPMAEMIHVILLVLTATRRVAGVDVKRSLKIVTVEVAVGRML
jgi:hypothetical protein